MHSFMFNMRHFWTYNCIHMVDQHYMSESKMWILANNIGQFTPNLHDPCLQHNVLHDMMVLE